jgi:Smg protein
MKGFLMKENVFDVLMYLFENYYMDDEGAATPDRERVQQELHNAGFPAAEIDRAFNWLEDLASDTPPPTMQAERSLRLFSQHESKRLDTECRGFLLFLEQMGVLNPTSRELVIDRAMALENEDFGIEQLKWVVLMVLFNQPGEDAACAWLEDLVYENMTNCLH